MHPGQKLKPGARVVFEGTHTIHGEILERRHFGRRIVRLWTDDGSPLDEAVDAIGHMPLPPYIKRDDRPDDRDRYQTVFAQARGSIAAPTAGLHFTPELTAALARARRRRSPTSRCTSATARFSRSASIASRIIASKRSATRSAPPAADAINRARAEGRRVIAVGTTTTRTLEAVARAHGGAIVAGRGRDRSVPLSGRRVPDRRRPADQLSPAAVVAPDAGRRRSPGAIASDPRMMRRSRRATVSTATATRC